MQNEERKLTVAPQVNAKPFAAIAATAAVEEPAGRVTRSRSEVDTLNAHVSSYGADASKGNMLALNPSLDSKLQKIFELIDTDSSGDVDKQEFQAFLMKQKNKTTQALLVRTMNADK